jgi:Zn-dependent protease with chaperone function
MIEFAAKYYDGVTSKPHDVNVVLAEGGSLEVRGLAQPVSFPLGSVRLSPRLGSTARTLYFPGGATCESDAHDALAALEQHSGGGKGAALLHALESRWRSALVAALLLVGLLVIGAKWGIPYAAKRVAQAIPARMAYDLGKGTLAVLDQVMLDPSHLDPARQDELELAFGKMAKAYPELPLRLVFRRGIGPNAFALPDGTVVATDELIRLAKNDEQILSVLAHEIGHVHHRHSLRMALESSTVLVLLSSYLGDVAQVTTLSHSLPTIYAQAQYSQSHETEADEFAYDHLGQAGIPRHHFADILEAMQKGMGKESKGGLQYVSSHPLTSERIRRFRDAP